MKNSTIVSDASRSDKTWNLKSLQRYALDRADAIGNFGRKTLTQTWLFGESLSFIQEITKKKGGWMDWVKTQPYSLSTAVNAIKVYKRIGFDELESFVGVTGTDIKIALDILNSPPPKKLRKQTPAATTTGEATEQSSSDAPEQATEQSSNDAPERKVTTTDYSRGGSRKNSDPEVGAKLTAAEILGQANNLLIEAEEIGITPECMDILAQMSERIATLTQTLKVVVAA
jgi:hypothetical protein